MSEMLLVKHSEVIRSSYFGKTISIIKCARELIHFQIGRFLKRVEFDLTEFVIKH